MSWSDSSSVTGTIQTATTSSTVPGPGAIAGKFLKAVGETSLDLVVGVIIRIRLGSIERTLEKNPRVLRNPSGDKEWHRLTTIYTDLNELCRESRSGYYSLSTQKTAARLVQDITLITRSAPEFYIDASPTNEKWEALLARVERRQELLAPPQGVISKSTRRDSISSYLVGGSFPTEKWEAFLARLQRRKEVVRARKPRVAERRSSLNSSCLEQPTSPSNTSDDDAEAQAEKHAEKLTEEKRKRRSSVFEQVFDHIFKPRKSEGSESSTSPSDSTRKVLVLGAGGVGKSTLVTQFQASVNGESRHEGYGDIIFNYVMDSMRNILFHVDPLDLSEDAHSSFEYAMDSSIHTSAPRPSLGNAVRILWQEPAVRNSARLARLSEPGLESADYFFDSAHRIFESDYVPTHEDIVRSRARTTGIWEYASKVQNSPWLVIDTGGERSERKKWVNCFSDVTAIFFVVALSDYNKTLSENSDVSRMEESLGLFESIANSPWFAKTFIVLLFNKVDAFVETLKESPLNNYYPDYTGEDTYDACQYFERRFLSVIEDKNRPVVGKYICAVNTEATQVMLHSVQDDINRYYENNVRPL